MLTVQRLYLKDFFTLLFIVSVGLSLVFSMLEVVNKIDEFPSATALILYALYSAPRFFVYLLPMSMLVCSLFTFSQAFRRKEMVAIQSAGGRLRTTIFVPFIVSGILMSLLSFVTGEIIAPDFSSKAVQMKTSHEGKRKSIALHNGSIWLKARDGSPVRIDLFIAEENLAKGIDIFSIENNFLKERLIAEKASWNGDTWILESVIRYDLGAGSITKMPSMKYDGLDSPDLFAEEIRKPDEMGITQLYRYIHRLKTAGFSNTKLLVDLNSKISFPLINTFMILLGVALSATQKLGSGLFSAGLGLVISMVYWFSYTFMLSLGYAGILPPLIAAWIIPVCFAIGTVWLFTHISE